MSAWGLLSAANAFVQDAASFYVLRFTLGIAEAAFFPGMVFYLTLWFPQEYRARVTAWLATTIAITIIIGAPLSGLILGMNEIAGLHGWQWLFLIEGGPAFLLAFAVLKFLPDGPEDAPWLSREEKEIIAARLTAEETGKHREVWPALSDPRVFALGVVNFGLQAGYYGVTLWLPQIVKDMGFSNFVTGLVVALPFGASVVAMTLWGRSSDSKGERIWHVAIPALLTAIGFATASLAPSNVVAFAGLSMATIGILSAFPPSYALPTSFLSGAGVAGGVALCNMLGILGGFAGPYAIGALKESTGNYSGGMAALTGMLIVSAAAVLALRSTLLFRPVLTKIAKVS
jgi:ACS family tartrate transporter-like MFS transporter